MAGDFMRRGEVQAVIVGADRIAMNGDVANKIGTYTLAILCRYHQVPFYVAAPFSTVDLALATGDQIPIEERAPQEITTIAGIPIAPEGFPASNPAFDVTPAALVSALITDRGVLYPPLARAIETLRRSSPRLQPGPDDPGSERLPCGARGTASDSTAAARRDPASRELHHRVLPSQDPTTGRGPCPARAGGGRVRPPGRLRDVLRRSGGPRPPRPAQKYYPPVPPPCPVPE